MVFVFFIFFHPAPCKLTTLHPATFCHPASYTLQSFCILHAASCKVFLSCTLHPASYFYHTRCILQVIFIMHAASCKFFYPARCILQLIRACILQRLHARGSGPCTFCRHTLDDPAHVCRMKFLHPASLQDAICSSCKCCRIVLIHPASICRMRFINLT